MKDDRRRLLALPADGPSARRGRGTARTTIEGAGTFTSESEAEALAGSTLFKGVRAARAIVALLFVGLFLWEAARAHRGRFLQSARAITEGATAATATLDPKCLQRHALDPGLCAVAASERAAVEWLVQTFEPDALPIPYSEDVRELVRMRYYARAGWNRRRDGHCVLYYSRGGAASLWSWLPWTRTAAVGSSSLLSLPESAQLRSEGSHAPLRLSEAVGVCSALESREAERPGREQALESCRRLPARRGSSLEALGLGGIAVEARASATLPARVSTDALVVTAGVAIDSVVLLLVAPDGEEVGNYYVSDVGAFARRLHWEHQLAGESRPGRFRARACVVDSEGFVRAAETEVRASPR